MERIFGSVFSSVFTFATIADKIAKGRMWNNINLGVDPVLVVSSYDKIEDRVTVVVGKWNGYPTMSSSTEVLGNVSYQINQRVGMIEK